MFTGIVNDIGEVVAVEPRAEGLARLKIACGYDPETIAIGASIACSGVCLTVVGRGKDGNRAWFRFAFKWPDPKTGAPRSRAGMQSYRIDAGKLAETWLVLLPLGSAWADPMAQARWTSPPPIK